MRESYDQDILRLSEPARVASAINPRLGIVGGGQLAKMTALAGLQLGCDVVVLERNNYSPAANLASHSIVGDWDNSEALLQLTSPGLTSSRRASSCSATRFPRACRR